MLNQCDGCRRGLKVDKGIHRGPGGFWAGDVQSCTKHLYEDNDVKKTIKYIGTEWGKLEVGGVGYINLAEDHPNTDTRQVRTSEIVKVEENGNFETLNTYYVKV